MQRLLPLLISTVFLGAQAPPESTAYSVAYVDIVPASRTAAITAIKQYRDASRKDDGFQRIEFFEQAGRPAHSFASWPKPAGKKKAISGSMSYSTLCGRIISRLSKNGRPRKQSRRMRLRLTRRNTGTALGRSPAVLWTNVFTES